MNSSVNWPVVLRSVDNQSVPLSFDVIVRRLLGDIYAFKLQTPGNLLLPLEYHQRDLNKVNSNTMNHPTGTTAYLLILSASYGQSANTPENGGSGVY